MFVVFVLYCQVEVSATRSLVQMSPIDCEASLCGFQKSHEWGGGGGMACVEPQ